MAQSPAASRNRLGSGLGSLARTELYILCAVGKNASEITRTRQRGFGFFRARTRQRTRHPAAAAQRGKKGSL